MSLVRRRPTGIIIGLWDALCQWFPKLFEPLLKQQFCLVVLNVLRISDFENLFGNDHSLIPSNIVILVLHYPAKNRILPPGDNLSPVLEPLHYATGVKAGQFLGAQKNFDQISLNLPEKTFEAALCVNIFSSRPFGMTSKKIYCNDSANISKHVGCNLPQIFKDFAHISTYFAWIFTESEVLGMRLHQGRNQLFISGEAIFMNFHLLTSSFLFNHGTTFSLMVTDMFFSQRFWKWELIGLNQGP